MKQGPKRWFAPVIYSDIFGRTPTRDNLASFVRELPYQDLVPKLSAIALLSWQRGIEEANHQKSLVENLLLHVPEYAGKIRTLIAQSSPQRILITRETLLALIRVAIVEESSNMPATEAKYADALVRAALAANEILASELLPGSATGTAIDLLASELRSAAVHIDNPHVLLGRTHAFFQWSKSARGLAHRDALPIEADLERFTGLKQLEYAAGAYAVLARTVTAKTLDEIKDIGVVFSTDQFLAGIGDSRVPRTWLDISSVPIEEIREEWRHEISLSFAGAGSLYRRPVIKVEGLNLAPNPDLLANCSGDGTYFALLDSYGNEDKNKLGRYHGAWFEDHVAGVFERGYAARAGTIVRRETEYAPGQLSSDIVVLENGDVLFIEVVGKRMNLVRSILRLEPSAIAADLNAGVLRKLRQLQKNIDQYRAGVLFPDFPRTPGQRIFPVLVSPKAFPRIYLIAHILKDAMANEGLLQTVEPAELMTVDEVEDIEDDLAHGLVLTQLLLRKNRSAPERRFMTLNNYLIDEEPGSSTGRHLALERGSAVAKKMIELMQSWHLPGDRGKTA